MKIRLLLLAGFLFTLASCKKSETETQPDLAATVLGTYTLSSISVTGATPVPISGVNSGTAVATRSGSSMDQVNFAVIYNVTVSGINTNFSQNQIVDLKPAGNDIDLFTGTTKFGTYSANTISVKDYVYSGINISFVAKKQ